MQISPTPGRVLVELTKDDPLEQNKIFRPDKAKDQPQLGKVIAVGGDYLVDGVEKKMLFKPGQFVYFKKWQGLEMRPMGKDHKLVHAEDIEATVDLEPGKDGE